MAMHQGVKKIIDTAKRFPLPVICSLLFCTLMMLRSSDSCYKRHFIILFSECFWHISMQLYAERNNWSIGKYYLMTLPISGLIAWYFYAFSGAAYAFPFLGAGLFLLMFIAPFMGGQAVKETEIWWFQYRLFTQICFTILISFLLAIFTCFTLYSFELLFDIRLSNALMINYIFPIIVTFLAPVIAMSGIPNHYTFTPTDYPKLIRLTLSYCIVPALLVYCTILYAYAAKILLSWQLPIGILAYLLSFFGVLGIITYVVSYPFRKTPGILKFFNNHFFTILPGLIVLLGVAIWRRINECGVTESRYFIFLLLIWFVLSTFFHFFAQENHVVKCMFTTIALQFIIASFGPFGAVSISAWSQNHRLEKTLIESGILKDGKLHKLVNELDNKTIDSIKSMVKYLVETEKTNRLKIWLQSEKDQEMHNHVQSITTSSILEKMGLSS